jgi:hypothetical protein
VDQPINGQYQELKYSANYLYLFGSSDTAITYIFSCTVTHKLVRVLSRRS